LRKPLFSLADKDIESDPTQAQLETIPAGQRKDFLWQRLRSKRTIQALEEMIRPELRILYLSPDHGSLFSALSLVRPVKGMGVDRK
jgi:hypothetical protein